MKNTFIEPITSFKADPLNGYYFFSTGIEPVTPEAKRIVDELR